MNPYWLLQSVSSTSGLVINLDVRRNTTFIVFKRKVLGKQKLILIKIVIACVTWHMKDSAWYVRRSKYLFELCCRVIRLIIICSTYYRLIRARGTSWSTNVYLGLWMGYKHILIFIYFIWSRQITPYMYRGCTYMSYYGAI